MLIKNYSKLALAIFGVLSAHSYAHGSEKKSPGKKPAHFTFESTAIIPRVEVNLAQATQQLAPAPSLPTHTPLQKQSCCNTETRACALSTAACCLIGAQLTYVACKNYIKTLNY